MLRTVSGWVETGTVLPILGATNFGMCSNGAFPVSRSRHIDPVVEAWQSTATSF
jgi:hypothetical protein